MRMGHGADHTGLPPGPGRRATTKAHHVHLLHAHAAHAAATKKNALPRAITFMSVHTCGTFSSVEHVPGALAAMRTQNAV